MTSQILTLGQAKNPEWFELRKNRITASNFGDVIDYMDRPSEIMRLKLINKIKGNSEFSEKSFINTIVKWGTDHEDEALAQYSKQTEYPIEKTGFWIFKDYDFLGASPDGLVLGWDGVPFGVIEIKCPFSIRYEEIGQHPPSYLNELDLTLKTHHKYYHQIQGQLYATKLDWCEFVVWTTKGIHVERIAQNKQWAELQIPKLVKFYEENIRAPQIGLDV